MRSCLFWRVLLVFVKPRAQCARLGSSEILRMDSKQIFFMRHAESMGNLAGSNPLKYAGSSWQNCQRPDNAWKDGRLSPDGAESTVDKIQGMNETLVRQLLESQLVLMSPLARSIATTFVVLATACKRVGVDPSVLDGKVYMVVDELREKVASDSDVPGANCEDNGVYIRRLAKEYSERFFSNPAALDTLAGKFAAAYEAEKELSDNWGRGWDNSKKDFPDNPEKFLQQIGRFKERVSRLPFQTAFAVGHNGWSRWAFAAWLMPPCLDRDDEGPLARLAFGGREVRPLPNLGLVSVALNQGAFSSFRQWPDDQDAPAQNCVKKTKYGLFSSVDEARAAGLLPRGAVSHRMMLKRESGKKDHVVTFSASGNRSYLAWSEGFAEPQGFVELTSRTAYACDHYAWKVHIAYTRDVYKKKLEPIPGFSSSMTPWAMRPFALQARNASESLRLCNLLTIFTRFAKDTSFVSKVLSEDTWANQTVYASQDENLLRLDDMPLSKWDREYESLHRSSLSEYWAMKANLPTPLWRLHKATREHGLMTVDKWEDAGVTCTKFKWLGITWVEYCD
mmetsp:Transcript_65918/g.176359  ORF Transcript_65918/g.176359 Transcript_65918/m.176359 type:complete len:564 (+) Transcript_65918:52-1743(+)